MPTVTVSFTPLPAHVRTARFIAASVARRAGVPETVLDEVRLAVSEACSLAVRLHRASAPDVPVELRMVEEDSRFRIQVVDAVPRSRPTTDDVYAAIRLGDDEGVALTPTEGSDLQSRERIGLAVITGLVDEVDVEYLASGTVIAMAWPLELPDREEASTLPSVGG
ncbi:MAG TPA: ATP-binding protein [Acidothermaceae bacterium]|nr:ATP-binding protein [Acidothermaceae bacterium]